MSYYRQLSPYLDALFGPFEEGSEEILRKLEDDITFVTVKSGEDLFRQNDPAEDAFILIGGALRVAIETPDDGEKIINWVARGETVGEMALLSDDSRSATVYAVRDSTLAKISRRSFLELIERHPRSMLNLSRLIIDRLKRHGAVSRKKSTPSVSIALVPTDSSMPTEALAHELADGLRAFAPSTVLTSTSIDEALGSGVAQSGESESDSARLSEWIHDQEEAFHYVVYVADSSWTPWTERCLGQADHIASVADGDGRTSLGEIEERLTTRWREGRAPRRSLVLLHPADLERPRQTSRWIENRSVDSILHLRRNNDRDLARIVRTLAGRAVGLVFGGGGARGFAHVGVLKALEELGIEVDMIGGTSIGSCIAGYVAQGFDAAATQDHLKANWVSLLDYTLPITSLLEGRRISGLISAAASDWEIEDLWIPYFCVSTNLTTARPMIHRRGNMGRAIRASVAIPGVLPPVPENGELLIDGGVLNNLPIDAMRDMNPFGTVIAIDVFSPKGPAARSDYGLSLSGWKVALRRLMPWKTSMRVPGLADTMMRSTLVGASRARDEMMRAGLADYYQNIHVRGVGMLQFDAVDESVKIGYEDSIGRLRDWIAASGLRP